MYTTGLYHNGVKYEWGKECPKFPYYTTTANTILYCPLNEDIIDKTGTFTMTGSGATIQNFNGVDCAKFSNSYIQTSTNYQKGQTITVSLAVYIESNGNLIGQFGRSSIYEWSIRYFRVINNYINEQTRDYSLSSGWNTLTVVLPYSSSYPIVYINGMSTGSTGTIVSSYYRGGIPIYIGWDGDGTPGFKGYISNVIIENGDWGATKALERHNTVKSYYGIS